MLVVPLKYGMSSIPLFIEQAPNHYHLSNEMGHLTRLSTGDTDVDDENEEDDRDDVIDTNEIHLPNDDENCCQRENIDLVMVQQVVESESTRFVNLEDGDRSNNLEVDFKVENTSLVASPHGTQVNISNDNLDATKDENIGNYGYIGISILRIYRIYRRYIGYIGDISVDILI